MLVAAMVWLPPSMFTSPPSVRAWTPVRAKPVSLKLTTPRARASIGMAGEICTSFPGSVTLP